MNDSEYYDLFKKRGAIATKAKNEFVAMIPRIYKNRIYKKKGFGSIYECAAKLGSISHNVVDEVLRIDEKLKDKPKLKSKIAEVGLSKIKAVVNIATKETDSKWAEKVSKMTRAALETQVRDIRNSIPEDGLPIMPQLEDFENFTAKINSKTILKLKIIKQKMGDGTTWNEVFEQLADLPQPKPQKNPRPTNPKSRHILVNKSRELGGKCAKCDKPAKEIHHKKPWAIFRSHKNLEPLCKAHHELEHQTESTIDKKFRLYKFQPFS